MYETYYRLNADPFRLSPDHRFCFQHPSYKKARAYMRYSLTRAEGFVMITGRPGTGKTTLINDLLARLDTDKVAVARLATTQLQGEDFLRAVGYAFGIESQELDQATLLRDIERFLVGLHQRGRSALLVVDEAQDLKPSALTELRLLANIQQGSELLMQAFLIGQEQLATTIGTPEMEQFRQRIIAACHLSPLTLAETRSYIEHRISCAGWTGDPSIEGTVFRHIHRFSQGIPRQVNMICSRLFLHGCVEERHRLTVNDALSVLQELNRERLGPVGGLVPEPIEPRRPSPDGRPRNRRTSDKVRLRDAASLDGPSPKPPHDAKRPRPERSPPVLSSITPVHTPGAAERAPTLVRPAQPQESVLEPLTVPVGLDLSGSQSAPAEDDLQIVFDAEVLADHRPASAAPEPAPAAAAPSAPDPRPDPVPAPDPDLVASRASSPVPPAPAATPEESPVSPEDTSRTSPADPTVPDGAPVRPSRERAPESPPVAEARVRRHGDVTIVLPAMGPELKLRAGEGGKPALAARRVRTLLIGFCLTAGLLASGYVLKNGYLELWAGEAATWFEQAEAWSGEPQRRAG